AQDGAEDAADDGREEAGDGRVAASQRDADAQGQGNQEDEEPGEEILLPVPCHSGSARGASFWLYTHGMFSWEKLVCVCSGGTPEALSVRCSLKRRWRLGRAAGQQFPAGLSLRRDQ